MNREDIKTLVEILQYKKRSDLAELLDGSFGEVNMSGQYGSRWNSILSEYIIYAPVSKYYVLRSLGEKDLKLIEESILEMYPIADDSPEITSLNFRILKENPNGKSVFDSTPYLGKTIRVFISYSTKDRKIAGEIRELLNKLGCFEVFLAHEDIIPSMEWQEVIVHNLKSADIFLPVITKNYKFSDWTDQESGVAFAQRKLIIPIGVDGEVPYGFLSRYQALRVRSELIDWSTLDIVKIIHENRKNQEFSTFTNVVLNALIKRFATSVSFSEAGEYSKLLLIFDYISKDQMEEIVNASTMNSQIYQSWEAQSNLRELFKKHPGVAEISSVGALERISNVRLLE